MITLENADILEGDSTNAAEVDFTIHGLDNNTLKQLADGQLAAAKGTIYTSDSTDVVSSIILVNTGAAHNHVNLYLKPFGGTSRRLIAKDLQLESGYSLHFDGAKVMVLNTSGQIIYVGATGADGAPGSDGTNGTNGTDGAAATIAIGTVTSGTPAAVTNVGTPAAAVLDFTLVTGDTGAQGPSGTLPIAAAGGQVDAITADYTPDLTLTDQMICAIVAAGANITTTPTFAPDGLAAYTIVKKGGSALVAGDIAAAGMVCILEYNLANTRWELLNPAVSGSTITFASAAEILTGTEPAKAIAPDQLLAANIRLPMGHLSGLAMSHDVDIAHDILIAVGKCRDSTDTVDIVLTSALVKRADADWAVGSTNGGMDTGMFPASATLHVWLIKRSDTGVVDALFSISATAPTMPANYDYKRLIGSYRTNVASNIINGDWWGTGLNRTFMFDVPILDVSNAGPGTNAVTVALSVPDGIITKAIINFGTDGVSSIYGSSLNSTDMAPSVTAAPLLQSYDRYGAQMISVFTNTSSQIRHRSSANVAIRIATLGYEMSL